MYRTDKQFMTNPATASSRIYIGGLAKTIVASDLEEKFKAHGKILGLVLQMGFAFIQYESDSQAQTAIQKETNSIIHGRKICVRQAVDKSQKGANHLNNQNRRQAPPPQPPQIHNNHEPPQQAPPSLFAKPVDEPMKLDVEMDKEVVKTVPPDDLKNEGPPEKRPRKRRLRSGDRFGNTDGFYNRDDYQSGYNRTTVIDQPDRNDCEIIVVSKQLTKYAEYIEQRLKALGLTVDLLFPNEDVPIGRVLANISSRGCLFAILVMPQNEEHRSLTLNILHGIPQEHRNMPIEDALVLLTRNFDAYMRGDKSAAEAPSNVTNVSERHPTSMQLLLNLLAENRQLTTAQYDRVLKYLQDRREVQQQHEIVEGVDQESQESSSKQAELQSRIMTILNKTTAESQPVPEAPPAKATTPPLLKDPSVQRALDSLLGGEMFKNISVAI